MIPYPCWLPSASAVRIRNVASCIARSVILTLYTAELAVATLPELPHRHDHAGVRVTARGSRPGNGGTGLPHGAAPAPAPAPPGAPWLPAGRSRPRRWRPPPPP